MTTIELASLWPDFNSFFLWLFQYSAESELTTQILSAGFVSFLLLIFVSFLLYAIFFGLIPALINTSRLLALVKELEPGTLARQRRSTMEKAETLGAAGKIWIEFDESLVTIADPSGERLSNTLDSNHFFNTYTLAPRLSDNRLLAAVPGFLTAIGVIGTFVGLQIGLESVDFSGTSEEQREDIQLVIASAAVAFLTSVWGVGTSVIFNFIEKILEQRVKSKILHLQKNYG